jgi:hypothetical protein
MYVKVFSQNVISLAVFQISKPGEQRNLIIFVPYLITHKTNYEQPLKTMLTESSNVVKWIAAFLNICSTSIPFPGVKGYVVLFVNRVSCRKMLKNFRVVYGSYIITTFNLHYIL